jgi:hypothetical protein
MEPPQMMQIPTFDVGDLEKKSPEELDALLRQLDDYGSKAKNQIA